MANSIRVESFTEGTMTVKATGDLDYGKCSQFRKAVDQILKPKVERVVVDLSEVEYIDSSGLGLLLSLNTELASSGRMLVLVTNETVNNVFALTRLNDLFTTVDTVEEAIEELRTTTPGA